MRIFKYITELDCFVVNPEYKIIADQLGLTEWSEVVWIGRFFALDNDYGEHWFDNWEERDALEQQAKAIGIEYDDLLVINPKRFKNDYDGPTHSDLERKNFWTDVLKSLDLSIDTIIAEAIKLNNEYKEVEEPYISDLDEIITKLKNKYQQ
ncbi:MAG: hypothetical protein NXI20_01685 [bacterium]|nr:hypothetical protein [bacterium]